MIKEFKLQGIYTDKTRFYTKNLVPGTTVYDERLFHHHNTEFREWNPRKSKLAAGLLKGMSQIGLKPGHTVLYLGASTGTTVSHISDIVGKSGIIYAVEFSPRSIRQLVFLSNQIKKICPILAASNNT